MIKWPADTRSRLLLLSLGTLLGLAALRVAVVSDLEDRLKKTTVKLQSVRQQLREVDLQIAKARNAQLSGDEVARTLPKLEAQMAQGDSYRWAVTNLAAFEKKFHLGNLSISPPQLGEADLPPKLPFPQATYTIAGSAYYHDFGAFLADFENRSIFTRLRSLSLEAAGAGANLGAGDSTERLGFRMEFTTLVNTNAPVAAEKP